MPIQTTTTALHNIPPSLLLFKFEDKLFHWLIGVKCPKIYSLKFAILFQSLSHFPITLSSPFHHHFLLTCCYCVITFSLHSVPTQFPFSPFTNTHTTFAHRKILLSSAVLLFHIPLVISTSFFPRQSAPLSYTI